MMYYRYIIIVFTLCLLFSCKNSKKIGKTKGEPVMVINLDTMLIAAKKPVYQSSYHRYFDLIHTRLELSFDYEKQQANGQAWLSLKPFFYDQSTLVLDAKGFDIHQISMAKANKVLEGSELDYDYDQLKLEIELPRTYTRDEIFEIYIDYTAKPNELNLIGSEAITDRKGLYFIDPFDTIPNKPRQIWTQGETEASSCWFPTIDSPNERTSQEMFITVEEQFKTISNGKFISSKDNGDGTRTDYWKQEIPHAPYLFMMAIGDFAEIKDNWNDIPMNYYVDAAYAPYAKQIFGNTAEMLSFYGEKFGMEYPWDKYHQVVVHDFVSGAMENTGAVIHFDGLHQNDRDLLDGDREDIIAHEVAHHWFGDYVTCESWANIALNEAFATWAELIWEEHKYGRNAVEQKVLEDRSYYFAEYETKQVPLIRFYYEKREEVFDRHSYQKGGQILWMLQEYLGDDAFYAGLKHYLEDNALDAVEVHDLRIALEDVCGEDLNWFFNTWFMEEGHPILDVEYDYDKELGKLILSVEQTQEIGPLFRIPAKLDIYYGDRVDRKTVWLEDRESVVTLNVQDEPTFVNFDPDRRLLAEINFKRTKEEYLKQFELSPSVINRYESLEGLAENQKDEDVRELFLNAMEDPFYGIRLEALRNIDHKAGYDKNQVKKLVLQLASKDDNTTVRSEAIDELLANKWLDDEALLMKWVNDRSYRVSSSALMALSEINEDEAIKIAKTLEDEDNVNVKYAVGSAYAKTGDKAYNTYYQDLYEESRRYGKYTVVRLYGDYLKRINEENTILDATAFLKDKAINESQKWLRYRSAEAIYNTKITQLNRRNEIVTNLNAGNGSELDRLEIDKIERLVATLDTEINEIKSKETDDLVKNYYQYFK